MKNKKVLLISLAGVFLISLSTILVFADTDNNKDDVALRGGKQGDLNTVEAKLDRLKELKAKSEANKKALTEEQKAYESKLKAIREDVWQDIKATHDINEDEYLVLEYSQFNVFFKGELEGFSDKEFLKQVQPIINSYYFNLTSGSTRPFVLIKKDSSEVAVAYKDKEGSNLLFKAKKDGSDWVETKEVKKGKTKLSVNDVN
jgi:hypothetical protein